MQRSSPDQTFRQPWGQLNVLILAEVSGAGDRRWKADAETVPPAAEGLPGSGVRHGGPGQSDLVYTVVYPRVCAVNSGPRVDQACRGFAQLLASMPDVGRDSDFERPRTSAEGCDVGDRSQHKAPAVRPGRVPSRLV